MEVFGDTIFYYSEGTKEDASNKELLQAGVGAITGLGSALAQRDRRALSEVEQKCGKKPLFGRARQQWQQCVNSVNETAARKAEQSERSAKTENNLLIIGSVGGVLVVIGLVVYAIRRKNK